MSHFLRVKSGKIARATAFSGWYDIFSSQDAIIAPGLVTRVKTGLVTEFSKDLRAVIGEKSGRALSGLQCLGGCIDADYKDAWAVMMTMLLPDPRLFDKMEDKQRVLVEEYLRDGYVLIKAGTAVAQFKLEAVPAIYHSAEEGAICALSEDDRKGGYGSTDQFLKSVSDGSGISDEAFRAISSYVKGGIYANDKSLGTMCGKARLKFHESKPPGGGLDSRAFEGTIEELAQNDPYFIVAQIEKL